ncbi:hypothetical protein [Pareuzebyella sediminis]|uniref:hypothetical protein n=1 Tax=Pareuzebyella sediminis TaxID=2607998 RepID=UPI0011EE62BC|nr:hypothetical protein [Pareuzebyella sediminis]
MPVTAKAIEGVLSYHMTQLRTLSQKSGDNYDGEIEIYGDSAENHTHWNLHIKSCFQEGTIVLLKTYGIKP